jgi:prepilin-type N-terminal cleavage/methylation domain
MYLDTNRYIFPDPRRPKGYTLIEVLVAMLIFTAMLMLAGVALNQGLTQYHGLVEKGLNFWNYAKNIWIDKSFNSATDYYVYTRSDGWFPYFKGSQDGVSYVSLVPFAGELPVIVWIKSEDEDGGKYSLVYYETPVYTKTYEEIDRDYVFGDYRKGKSFKLLEGVKGIEFSFYGYDFAKRMYQWYSSFDGNKMKVLPALVKISYTRDLGRGDIVVGINVNSLAKRAYNADYPR